MKEGDCTKISAKEGIEVEENTKSLDLNRDGIKKN